MALTTRFRSNDIREPRESSLMELITELDLFPLFGGRIIENITLTAATALRVDHKLGKVPQGFIEISSTSNNKTKTNAKNRNSITIENAANAAISIYVF